MKRKGGASHIIISAISDDIFFFWFRDQKKGIQDQMKGRGKKKDNIETYSMCYEEKAFANTLTFDLHLFFNCAH